MCLAVPAKIVKIDGEMGEVDLLGVRTKACFALTPEARLGDYVILHAGYSIQVIDEETANEIVRDLEGMDSLSV